MIITLKKTRNINTIGFFLILLLSCAGFSQVQLSGIKPSDIITILLFFFLIVKNKIRLPFIGVIFIAIFFYGWVIGGLSDFKLLITNTIMFLIMFSLIDYLKKLPIKQVLSYLQYFNFSMFLSNLITLIVLILLPSNVELIADMSSGGIRLKGFFNQTNGYAFVLLLSFPIAVYFLSRQKSVFNIVNVIIFLISIILTQSRGVLYSLIIGFVVVYFIYLFRSKKIKRIIGPLILFFLALFGLFAFLPQFLQQKFGINLSRFNSDTISDSERNLNSIRLEELQGDRLYLVEAGLNTIAEYPFGLGYQPHHTIIGELTGVFLIPHNYFLSIMLYYGVIIGLLWVVVVLYLIKKGLSKISKLQEGPNNILFYLVILMISWFFFYLTHSSEWSFMYIIIAFYVALLNRNKTNNETISNR